MPEGQQPLDRIEEIELQEEMEHSFLEYAMSVIVSRALPDARDGLKPVHRRILYGMYDAGLRPDRAHVKCAKVVGDVMGRFHPHGDQAIYDALARMVQDFSLRHPLVDGHGSFGSPDPESQPAAMRYCLAGDTRVRTVAGTHRIDDLVPGAERHSDHAIDRKVLGREGDPVRASMFFHSGEHPTLRLQTREGYELTGTHNHPVLTLAQVVGVPVLQWRFLEEVRPGDWVVLSRHEQGATEPEAGDEQAEALGLLAGALVSEGWFSSGRAGFSNTDAEYFTEVVDAFDRVVGGPRYTSRRTLPSGRVIHELDVQDVSALIGTALVELQGHRSRDKRIPTFVWAADPGVKRRFLQALFEGDGSCSDLGRSTVQVSYSTRSARLAREVQELLLEFGIVARRCLHASGEHKVVITNRRDAARFGSRVGFLSAKVAKLERILSRIPVRSRALSSDHIPFLADYLRSESGARGADRTWLAKHNVDRTQRWEQEPREILGRVPSAEARAVAAPLVTSGYYFARVASITDAGVRPVYSIRVDSDDHAFIAGGFVNHNTECRLAPVALRLLDGIDEETVDRVPTYDGKDEEPAVLPARFPNLLVNGSQGIAVGMATNIPPHNLGEVIDATIHLVEHPDATVEDLMHHVQGPDFPTGGLILGRQGIVDAYRTGRGSVRMRAVAEIEEHKGAERIVVTEIPYQTSVEGIERKIADLVNNRELDGVRAVRNESAKGRTRFVIELKKDANALVTLNNLYKSTPLQTSFGVNMLALVDGIPRTLDLVGALRAYVDHQVEVVTRRSEHRLQRALDRAHIVEGLLKALDAIDAIIALIRGSESAEAALAALMADPYEFSEVQARHILDMQLRRLARLEHDKLRDESAELAETISGLRAILGDRAELDAVIVAELREVRDEYATPRRTQLTVDVGELDTLDLIDDEEVVVVLTAKGYVKTVAADAFRTQGRGGRGVSGGKLAGDDYVAHLLTTTAHAYLLFFTDRGRVYRLRAHQIPMTERTARGTALVNLVPLQPDERVQAVIDTRSYEDGAFLLFATRRGVVKKTRMSEYDSSRVSGLIALKLADDDELVRVVQTQGDDEVVLVSRQGMTIRFSEDEVRPMGRSTGGVRGMRLKSGEDGVVSCDVVRPGAELLFVSSSGHGKRTALDAFNRQGRGGQGVRGMRLPVARGEVVAAFTVDPGSEVLAFSSSGNIVRVGVDSISVQGRSATGVRLAAVGEGEHVVAVAPVLDAPAGVGDEDPGTTAVAEAGTFDDAGSDGDGDA